MCVSTFLTSELSGQDRNGTFVVHNGKDLTKLIFSYPKCDRDFETECSRIDNVSIEQNEFAMFRDKLEIVFWESCFKSVSAVSLSNSQNFGLCYQ